MSVILLSFKKSSARRVSNDVGLLQHLTGSDDLLGIREKGGHGDTKGGKMKRRVFPVFSIQGNVEKEGRGKRKGIRGGGKFRKDIQMVRRGERELRKTGGGENQQEL